MRKHILATLKGAARSWGSLGAGFAGVLSGLVFVGQIVGKWTEGGWVVLISFSLLVLAANLLLISPIGVRDPTKIHRIVREKARVQGAMASIVEWQSLRMQEYRYEILVGFPAYLSCLVSDDHSNSNRPFRLRDYNHAMHSDHPDAPSLLQQYLDAEPKVPTVGGAPKETAPAEEKE